jgi:N-acetyl-anhydromuramyl-L-alanine amidase AmpD
MAVIGTTGSLGRKVDPGPLFPWDRLHQEYNVGAWHNLKESLEEVEFPHQNQMEWVRQHLVKYGYPHPGTWNEENTKKAVQTFQMHFCPSNISGIIDEETIRILASLVDRYIPKNLY